MSLNKRIFTGGPAPVENAFKAVAYTGNGSSNRSITGLGFQPDLVWIKSRSFGRNHYWYDTTRGANKQILSNATDAEATITGRLTAFNTDGFTLGSSSEVNNSGETYVAFAWACNGGTTSTNTDGNRNSTVQVNNDTGLSIVNYTGGDTGIGGSDTVGHGLTGIPRFIIGKSTNWANSWITYLHDGTNYYHGYLNDNGALTKNGSNTQVGTSSSLPTSSVINPSHVGTDNGNYDYMLWCWEPKAGYSSFGSYTGNGGGSNNVITGLGFQPDFLILRGTDSNNWRMYNSAAEGILYANLSNSEDGTNNQGHVSFQSDGFTLLTDNNNSNNVEHIYMAWRNAT